MRRCVLHRAAPGQHLSVPLNPHSCFTIKAAPGGLFVVRNTNNYQCRTSLPAARVTLRRDVPLPSASERFREYCRLFRLRLRRGCCGKPHWNRLRRQQDQKQNACFHGLVPARLSLAERKRRDGGLALMFRSVLKTHNSVANDAASISSAELTGPIVENKCACSRSSERGDLFTPTEFGRVSASDQGNRDLR